MSELRKANTDHPYFVTLPIVGWIDLFTRERYCEVVIDSLAYCINNKGLRLFEYVIMPSHVHLIVQHLEGKLPALIRDMKSFMAKEILTAVQEPGESRREWLLYLFKHFASNKKQNKQFMVWQKTSHPIELHSPTIYDQKSDYIRMNPVASGYTTDETSWKYDGIFSPIKPYRQWWNTYRPEARKIVVTGTAERLIGRE